MICSRNGCDRSDVERWCPGIYLCPDHREALVSGPKAQDQKFLAERDAQAHEIAILAAGWVSPPPVRKVSSRVSECSGGLPGLGKGQ